MVPNTPGIALYSLVGTSGSLEFLFNEGINGSLYFNDVPMAYQHQGAVPSGSTPEVHFLL